MAWSKRQLLVGLGVLVVCALTSATDHQKRHIQSSQPSSPSQLIYYSDKSTTRSNEFTPERRVNHGLMGGHMKVESSTTKDTDDQATWDDGLLRSSAGNGKEKKGREEDDDKKTLAQQIKEGRYSLIQNEIFASKPKRPGIISYSSNPEVPKDTAKNLGGLGKDDIWMSENGLLVLIGGRLPNHTDTEEPSPEAWPPIDDYQAPKRQVRIPSQPKVPPPFPVQLTDDGPIQLIKTNNTPDGSQWMLDGLNPFNDTDESDDNATTKENPQGDRKTKSGLTLGGIVGPFFPSLPPGAVFVPPPSNQSDYDDDDQSIYYPPPYSFKYNVDNSTAVPPGPLVPGIILPPPPDFFSQSDEKKKVTTKIHGSKCPRCTTTSSSSSSSSKPSRYSPQKSNSKSHKVPSTTSSTKAPRRPFTMKSFNKLKRKPVTVPFTEPVTKSTEKNAPEVTTPAADKASLKIAEIETVRPVLNKQVIESRTPEPSRWTGGLTKLGPIIARYPTTTPANELIDVTVRPDVTTEKRPESLASYYFYEETNDEPSGTTATPAVYFEETTQSPYFKVKGLPRGPHGEKRKPYYDIEITPSQQTAEDYSVDVIEPVVKPSPRYKYTDSRPSSKASGAASRAQGQRLLSQTSPLYYQTISERPQINIQSFFATPSTRGVSAGVQDANRYDQEVKSKPVYQYSFEANGYSQRGRQQPIYKQEIQEQPQKQVTFNEWQDIQDEGQLYDYEGTAEPEQRLHHDRSPYKSTLPDNYETSTIRPIAINTTPNPAHVYYTKQEEQLLDDVTKEYFTNFGKKISRQKLQSTTPIYGKSSVTERPQIYPTRNSFVTDDYASGQSVAYKTPKVKVHYGDQSQSTYSLESDIQVNYQQPLPSVNPDAEYLPGYGPNANGEVVQLRPQPQRGQLLPILAYNGRQIAQQPDIDGPTGFVPLSDARDNQQIYPIRPISLEGDIAVNYRNPRPPINPNAELIEPVVGQAENSRSASSYFTYRLPGDGGHVYFITPTITQRQDSNAGSFLRQRGSRPTRRRRGPRNA